VAYDINTSKQFKKELSTVLRIAGSILGQVNFLAVAIMPLEA